MIIRLLTRLFTLICLMVSILAFGLISTMQQSTRPAYSWRVDQSFPCVFEDNRRCAIPHTTKNEGR
ncbi:MAG: hypothetical protein AAGG69_00865 [Pseudomonadota bacterium]